jgi:hypothetical protein
MHTLRRPEQIAARLVFCALVSGARALSQSATDGAVHGVVADANGRPVPVAATTLKNLETGEVRTGAAQRDGSFLIPHLAPGLYSVTIAGGPGPGPSTAVRYEGLQVSVDETTEIRATLAGGASTITGDRAALDRDLFAALLLPDQDDDGLPSVHGLAATQGAAVLDGAGVTQGVSGVAAGSGSDPAPNPDSDPDSGERTTGPSNGLSRGRHAGVAYVFSQAAVREFRVAGGNYSAQQGSAAGTVMTTVSRSGGQALHGSAGYTVRSQAFAAVNPLSVATSYANGVVTSGLVKPHDLRESFVGTAGGPVPRAHDLRFFYAFDAQRRGFPAVSSPADPNFYSLTATQRALLAARGVTTTAIESGLQYLSSLTGETPRRADEMVNFVRFDWAKHPRAALAAEYNAVRWSSPAGLLDAPVVARGRASLGNASGSLDAVVVRVTSLLAHGMSNKAHAAFLRDLQFETPQTPLAQEPAIVPSGTGSGVLAPEVNIGPNGLQFGTPASVSQLAYPDERRVELGDTLSVARGRHLLELGASVAFVHDLSATLTNAAGTFHYDSSGTKGSAGGLVDFLTDAVFNVNMTPDGGCPGIAAALHYFCFQSFSQSSGVSSVTFSTEDWAAFVEDTWRPRRNLTLHAGVRYEYTLLPIPQNPNLALDSIFGSTGATGSFPEDRNNFGPRVALAWEPLGPGRGTVRLGYGVYFGRLPGATVRAALADTSQVGGTTKIRITPTTVVACPQVPAKGFGYPCAFPAQPPGVLATTSSAVVFDRGFRLPTVQQGSLTLERTFGRTTISVGYVANLDRQLPSSTDVNIAPTAQTEEFQLQGGTGAPGVRDGEVFFLPVYTARRSPGFGPVTDVVSNVNATYHALVVSSESRVGRGLQVRGEYGWSKALDFGQAESATPRTDGQFDPFTNGYDKGLSSLNYPWAARAAAVWSPAARSRWLRGWQGSPIVTARAGRPYSFDLSGGTRLPGGHLSVNGSGGALYLPTVGRNTLRLPAQVNVDARVARGFRLGREVELRALAEAFNLLNRENVSSVTERAYLVGTAVNGVTPLVFQSAAAIAAEGLNTQAFGTVTAASSGLSRERRVQLSLMVSF